MIKKKRVLEGHKQIGKRFVTPLNQIDIMQETKYVERTMPELIWMDMLNLMYGDEQGIDMTMELCHKLHAICATGDNFINFTIASKYEQIVDPTRAKVLSELKDSLLLENVSKALAPLKRKYPAFPMAWLIQAEPVDDNDDDLDLVAKSVVRIVDKYTMPASIVQANVLYFRIRSGKISYASHVPTPDFQEMVTNPDSILGKRSASQARMGAMMEIAREEPDTWPRAFWNDNYKLSKCIYPGDES